MSLSEDAKAARKAKMTYGQYMATKPVKPVFVPTKRTCEWCGGILVGGQTRFCTNECRCNAREKTKREKAKTEKLGGAP